MGYGTPGCSPIPQPLLQVLQDALVKVTDSREFPQALPQLLLGQWLSALLLYVLQGPQDSSMEILQPQRPVMYCIRQGGPLRLQSPDLNRGGCKN